MNVDEAEHAKALGRLYIVNGSLIQVLYSIVATVIIIMMNSQYMGMTYRI